jgi:hypothetical protein
VSLRPRVSSIKDSLAPAIELLVEHVILEGGGAHRLHWHEQALRDVTIDGGCRVFMSMVGEVCCSRRRARDCML